MTNVTDFVRFSEMFDRVQAVLAPYRVLAVTAPHLVGRLGRYHVWAREPRCSLDRHSNVLKCFADTDELAAYARELRVLGEHEGVRD